MKFKSVLIALLILVNFLFTSPALADKPKFLKNPDYIEVTTKLDELKAKETQSQTEVSVEVQQEIDELEFQKYALETGINWGQCSNQTGKTLAVYGPKPDFDDDDFAYGYNNALYFLADGQVTKNKWDCDGVYLPLNAKTTVTNPDGKNEELSGPIVVKVADGTQLAIKVNPVTGITNFNIPPTKVIKAGEEAWFIPSIAQAAIDNRVPNAPSSKIADVISLAGKKDVEPAAVDTVSPQTKPQPELNSQPQSEPQSELKPLRTSAKTGFYRK